MRQKEENNMENKIRYFYLHDKDRHVTVGRVFDKNQPENNAKFTYAVCSPNDRFSRKFGREIVEKRFLKSKHVFTVSTNDNPMREIIKFMAEDKTFPACVRKAAVSWLTQKKDT